MTVSSVKTYSSLEMAQAESPAAEERMAVLEMRVLPGRESRRDCARFSGGMTSGVGVEVEAERVLLVPVSGRKREVVVLLLIGVGRMGVRAVAPGKQRRNGQQSILQR